MPPDSDFDRLLDDIATMLAKMPLSPQRAALVKFLARRPSVADLRVYLEAEGLVDRPKAIGGDRGRLN